MTDHRAGDQIVARIGFAERWLERAKRQVATGNLPRGVLTLVLADAEVHHAIEVAGTTPSAQRRETVIASAVVTVAVIAIVASLAVGRPLPGGVTSDAPAPQVVALSPRVGAMLALIPAPAAASIIPSTAAVHPAAGSVPARTSLPARPLRSPLKSAVRPQAAVPVVTPVPVAMSSPSTTLVTLPAVAASPQANGAALSTGELIDLVLAAERTLRSEPARP